VGQNNQSPPPEFENHYIVRYTATGNIFDPSYGSGPHLTWQGWTTAAIGGLWTYNPPVPPDDAGFAPPAAPANSVKLRDLVASVDLN
jgi:hypothetical protein